MNQMSAMTKEVLITKEGLEQLKSDLEYLSGEKRREVASRIKEAREFGDISENSEYNEAKNEQAMLETQILALEGKLRAAQVIDSSDLSNDIVRIGCMVDVEDQENGKSAQYKLVGTAEADPLENRLSNESPVGKALLGRSKGDVVTVQVPRGPVRKLKIKKIEVAKS